MAEYERVSSLIYSIILRYAAPMDIHVYSIDESFIDATPYLRFYEKGHSCRSPPAHTMAMTIIRDVLKTTESRLWSASAPILYLAKVAMDIVAKAAPDKDGVRTAELNEDSYNTCSGSTSPDLILMVGPRQGASAEKAYFFTMGDIAQKSQWDEEWFP